MPRGAPESTEKAGPRHCSQVFRRVVGSGLVAALAFIAGCTTSIVGPGNTTENSGGTAPSGGSTSGTGATSGQGAGTGASGGAAGASGGASAGTGSGTGAAPSNGAGGSSGAAGGSGLAPPFSNPPPFQPAAGMLRRLTRTQFRNALRDIFAVDVDVSQLDADSWDGDFAVIGAATVVTSELGVEQYQTAIENAVAAVFADATARSKLVGCSPTGSADDACVRGLLQTLGARAWRRPLEAAEVDRLATVAAGASATLGSPLEGVHWALVALFASPNFIYRPELGTSGSDGSLRIKGYEMASRLAFLVWNSLPDQALLDAAAAGTLDTAEGIRSAVGRMLAAPAGREAASAFAEEFMRLDRIATQAKDPVEYAEYAPALQAAMARDVRDTWAVVAFDDRSSLLDLFATPKVVVNRELAALYGIDTAGLTSTTFEPRSLPADGQRLGVLSKAGFLSEFANQKEGSPTLRGRWMREQLLCTPIDPPPPNVNTMLPDVPEDMPMTKRERLALHRQAKACAGCHDYMDPLGLPLESFDAIGRFRTLDNGLDVDPSGNFNGVPVANSRELSQAISADPAVAQCLVRKYYAYATGHSERDVDGTVLNTLATSFMDSGYQLRELVVAIATHDAFSSVAPQP